MTAVLTSRDATRKPLAAIYAPIQTEMAQVEALLKAELHNPHPFVDQLAKHAFRLAGKRLRPALLLLTAKATGAVNEHHIKLAAVVEMIHAATLVHDDILDEATVRRHRETVNTRFGNEASVLLGDYLFTHAFYLASTTGSTLACHTIGRATNITCEGELRQVHAAGRLDLPESEYLAIIEAKTAELCACSCELGAVSPARSLISQPRRRRTAGIWGSRFKSPTTCSTWLALKRPSASRSGRIWRSGRRRCRSFGCSPTRPPTIGRRFTVS